MPGFNKYELELFSKQAADAFVRDGVDLDDTITSQALENGFTDHHVDRVAQKANSFVNAALVKNARDDRSDPRVSFKLASAESIKSRAKGGHAKVAEDGRQARQALRSLFTVQRAAVDKTAAVRSAFGDTPRDPMAGERWSLDSDELAEAYVKQAHVAGVVASRSDVETVNGAFLVLDTMAKQARMDARAAQMNAETAEGEIFDEIKELILNGHNPATLRDVVCVGVGDEKLAAYVDGMITAAGAELGAREGRSSFVPGSAVNSGHPLLSKISHVLQILEKRAHVDRARDRLIKAAEAAAADLRRVSKRARA
jgi:hypothetical protein